MPIDAVALGVRSISAAAELQMLRAGLDCIHEAVVVTRIGDRETLNPECIAFSNAEFELLTGWTRADAIGRPLSDFAALQTALGLLPRVTEPQSFAAPRRIELLHPSRDGSLFWAEMEVSCVLDEKGSATHRVIILRDVSGRRALEEQLFQAQKVEAVGRLAGGVAHDFNNVLTAIGGFSELLLDELAPGTSAHGEVLQIKAASDRAAALTRQLLVFSRKQPVRPQHLDTNALVADMERFIRRVISASVGIRVALQDAIPSVYMDPLQFEQVLLNLVINASEAMADGGALSIESRSVVLGETYDGHSQGVRPGPYVCLVVSDTGAGMDELTRERMFEPFFTTKSGGTGLGLSTVHEIVRQSGGHVWVYTEVGVGSTFKVYLPASSHAPVALQAEGDTHVSGGHETVLVVEDETAVREVVQAMLERRGYLVLLAEDADQAVRLSQQHEGEIHLLLTDVVLPLSTGQKVAEQLQRARPSLQVLFMSGYTNEAISAHGEIDPGDLLVEKPFSELTLARRVREMLDRKERDREERQIAREARAR